MFKQEKQYLDFNDMVISDGYGYFSASNGNGLFKLNMKTKKVTLISRFTKNDSFTVNLHGQVKKVKNKLFFSPKNTYYMAVYDLGKKVCKKYLY